MNSLYLCFKMIPIYHKFIFVHLYSILLLHWIAPTTAERSNYTRALNFNILPSIFRQSELCQIPPDFPSLIRIKQETYNILHNENEKLVEEKLWTAVPRSSKDLVHLVNWAYIYDYKIRSKDLMGTLSPLAVTNYSNCNNLLIVDTNEHLVQIRMERKDLVKVQIGTSILRLLEFLEENYAGLPVVPLGDEITVGQAVAIGTFGTGVNPHGKKQSPFGTISSLIMNFRAIVWDKNQELYAERSFERSDPRSMGFLIHLGRAFLTEVTLLVGPNYHMRCQTFSNFLSENIFAVPNSTHSAPEESLAFLVEEYGKVEVSFYPYVDMSWVSVWTKEPNQPLGSLRVPKTYRSGSSGAIPSSITRFAMNLQRSFPSFTPTVSRFMFDLGVLRMRLSGTNDIWGTSQNILYTLSNDTQKYVSSGYAVITSRQRIQEVVSDFYGHFTLLLKEFQEQGRFPVNRPVRIRILGLESLPQMAIKGLVAPALSVLSPVRNHSDFDVAVVFEINHYFRAQEFVSQMESWFFKNYQGNYATVRPLWSTEWGHTREQPWKNYDVLKDFIPSAYEGGWSKSVKILEYYDPHKVFSNSFLDSFLSSEKQ